MKDTAIIHPFALCRRRTWFFCLFLLLFGEFCGFAQARVESTDLRNAAELGTASDRLLFWSSYDFTIDAAAQLFGPIDLILRGGSDEPANAMDSSTTTTSSDTLPVTQELPSIKTTVSDYPATSSQYSNQTTSTTTERTTLRRTTTTRTVPAKLEYSLFQTNDGSESDPDGIPTRFLLMHKNHRDMARQSLQAALEWRNAHDIDDLLNQPQIKYDICKAIFPHYFLGRDKDNRVVFVQRPALLKLEQAHRNNLTEEELLMHYVFVNEYLWQVVEKEEPLATMTSIIDMQGIRLGHLRKTEIISFVKEFVHTMDSYYPQRAHMTLVVNCPKWFSTLYKILSPLLRETTKAKIQILSRGKKQDQALKAILDEASLQVLPESFWSNWKKKRKQRRRIKAQRKRRRKNEPEEDSSDSSSSSSDSKDDDGEDDEDDPDEETTPTPNSELELDLRSFVLARIEAAGLEMQVCV